MTLHPSRPPLEQTTNRASSMKEKPILFSGPMVRAILDGRKTQTRRVVTDRTSRGNYKASELLLDDPRVFGDPGPSPAGNPGWYLHAPINAPLIEQKRGWNAGDCDPDIVERLYPWVFVGDRLWVRETALRSGDDFMYADDEDFDICHPSSFTNPALRMWRVVPSLFMPRWASRLTLEITDVRVHRVQEISEADAIAEGVTLGHESADAVSIDGNNAVVNYARLWQSLNAKRGHSWESNPWVWALSFSVVGRPPKERRKPARPPS